MIKFIKSIATLLTVLTMLAMIAIVYFATQEVDLSGIDGREAILKGEVKKESLFEKVELNRKREKATEITEESLNHYLASKVVGKQEGYGNQWATYKGVWVNLVEDEVQFFLEREIEWTKKDDAGEETQKTRTHVTQFSVQIKTTTTESGNHKITFLPTDSKIGQLPTPGQFARFSKTPMDRLAEILNKEMELFDKMVQVDVKDGKIVLTPHQVIMVKVAPGVRK